MKHFKTLFFGLFIILFLSSCEENSKNSVEVKSVEVGFINPKKEALFLEVELSGRVKASQIAQIRPQISGIVEKQLFTEGSYVKEGDILYIIDKASYEAIANEAAALLNSAKANLISTKARKNRIEELLKFDGVSKQEYDDTQAIYLQAIALVEQRAAQLESAKIDLKRCEIKAPISGYIGISTVTAGALVLANQLDALANIKDTKKVFVDLQLSYNELLNLKKIIDFEKDIELSLTFDDASIYPQKGLLKSKELSVDESSGTVTLRAIFDNINESLLSGMMIKATLYSSKKFDGFLIPQQAVLRDQKANPIVTLINEDNSTIKKEIKIIRAIGNKWLVDDVLNEDNKIVIEGLNKINSKTTVIPKDLNEKYNEQK